MVHLEGIGHVYLPAGKLRDPASPPSRLRLSILKYYHGAPGGNRTPDFSVRNAAFYPLNYGCKSNNITQIVILHKEIILILYQ